MPFNSRVNPAEPIGWNPCAKLLPKVNKKKFNPNGALARHRQFLKNLEMKKNQEREDMRMAAAEEEARVLLLRDQAERQRAKIRQMQNEEEA